MTLAVVPGITNSGNAPELVRKKIQSLNYLPTTVGVAMKLIAMGQDPEAHPAEYAQIISSDAGLSAKILALANSSWFGVRNRVTRPQVAVSLMGLGTVRTLAISYCLTGLHHELRLNAEESKWFWSASICKAIAARMIVGATDIKLSEEAFAAAIFQDIAIPVMYSVARKQMDQLLTDPKIECHKRLQIERDIFSMDHTEAGQLLAVHLDLPTCFQDMIRHHHGRAELNDVVDVQPMSVALYIASLLPHRVGVWHKGDMNKLEKAIGQLPPQHLNGMNLQDFLRAVDHEYKTMCQQLDYDSEHISLTELMEQAVKEIADNTTRLVGTVQELMNQAAAAGQELHQLMSETNHLEKAAVSDALTGVLNRHGFESYGKEILGQIATDPRGFALLYMDLDGFKKLNDTHGHAAGDAALKRFAETAGRTLRQGDLLARLGGDEFVIMLVGLNDQEASRIAQRLLDNVRQSNQGHSLALGLSIGVLWIQPNGEVYSLEALVHATDKLMYQAKRSGGSGFQLMRVIGKPKKKPVNA